MHRDAPLDLLHAGGSRVLHAPRPAMSPRALGTVLTAVIALVFCRLPAAADGPIFEVPVHLFQVTGNVFGSPGFVDDFSSGSLAPNWIVYFGTASESGGALHLTSPGADYPYVPVPNVVLDQSAVLGPVALKGHGDFVARSAWDASVPQLNNYQFFAIGNGTGFANEEDVGIGVWNLDADTALAFGAPGPGFAVTQTHVYIAGGTFTTNDTHTLLLDPALITGLIVLQIAYDDANDVVTTSFSLDGGVTFESPFPTNHFPGYNAGVSFALVTDPVILTLPTATSTPTPTASSSPTVTGTRTPPCVATPRAGCRSSERSSFLLRHGAGGNMNTMTWKWIKGAATSQAEFGNPTAMADYALCIYAGTASSLGGEAVIPASSTKWRALSTKGYKYNDPTGTEDGITKVLLKGSDQNKSGALLKGKGDGLPALPLPITAPLTVQLVNGQSGLCWGANYTGAQLLKNDMGHLKAQAP